MSSCSYSKKGVSICLLVIIAITCVLPTQVIASNPNDTIVGALRCDMWLGELEDWYCDSETAHICSENVSETNGAGRQIWLPAGKRLKSVDITVPVGTTGTVSFSTVLPDCAVSNNPTRQFNLVSGTLTLNWNDPSPTVAISVDTNTGTAAWNVAFDNFVIGDPETIITFAGISDGSLLVGWIPDNVNGIEFVRGIGTAVELSLSPGPNHVPETLDPNGYHNRVPFYGSEPQGPTGDVILARQLNWDISQLDRQAIMDQEIQYAKDYGLDYWAFYFMGYGYNDPTMPLPEGEPLALYLNSTLKNDINYCFIVGTVDYNTYPAWINWFIERFKDSNYQKISGRPLLYIGHADYVYDDCDSGADDCDGCMTRAQVDDFRARCIAGGAGDPYIVLQTFYPPGGAADAQRLGADAISAYCYFASSYGMSHSAYVSAQEADWNNYVSAASSAGIKYIPTVTQAWDVRPRIDNPVPHWWEGWGNWSYSGTPSEVAGIFQDAINLVNTYLSTVTSPNAILSYSWNELDEGGGFCPKLPQYGGAEVLAACANVWGSGTSAPTYVGAGAVQASANAITPPLPTGLATDDILLLFLETANQAISIANPNGGTWSEVTGSPQGTGTAGGTAATRLTVFWSRYNGSQGAPTTSDSGNHQIGRIIAIRGAATSGDPWDVTAGGVDTTADTSGAIPGATTTVADTLVVSAIATALPDANGTANFSDWANADLTDLAEQTDNTSGAGNGGGLAIATGGKTSAGAYGATTVTCGAATRKGMMSIAIKPSGGSPPPDTTVTFVNIVNDGDPINGWQDSASPDGINFGTDQFWAWDGSGYGLSTGKAASTSQETTRNITLPSGKLLKRVDIGKCGDATGTITFSNGTPSEDRVVDLSTCPRTNYNLNWTSPTPNVNVTVNVTNKTCAWSVVFDNFVFGD